ncbi:hypothetical protein ACFIJ5_01020 [Haloimpatiens sp. FM7330]|uniref:hypothetical protein n=1 Tax=Haloimpatiens sp. FM7330 TaxID=3298610 RepID=UPI00363B6622
MKYEIVALLDNNSDNYIHFVKTKLCKKYKLNKNSSSTYIHLETVHNPNVHTLDSVIHNVIKPYKKFKVKLDNDICIDNQNKSINLKIENKGYITRIARNIGETLSLHGINITDNPENLNLYIPLANTNNNRRNYYVRHNNFNSIPYFLIENKIKIIGIEVWKTINDKKHLVQTYALRDY